MSNVGVHYAAIPVKRLPNAHEPPLSFPAWGHCSTGKAVEGVPPGPANKTPRKCQAPLAGLTLVT